MKNAKHNDNLKAFVKKVLKETKGTEAEQIDPLRAIARGILSYDVGDARADEALAIADKEFCSLNELRVATELELQDMLGAKYPAIDRRAVKLVAILNALFEKEGTLTVERIKGLTKKEIRQYFRELPEMTPYIEAYIMMHGFDSPAVPVDGELMALLEDQEALEEGATEADVQRTLENLLKTDEYHDFHSGVRKLIAAKKKK